MSTVNEQVNELLNEFNAEDTSTEEWISKLGPEKVNELVKKLSPYKPLLLDEKEDEQMSFSYTNMTMENAKRIAMVSLVAFTFRMIKEYKMPEEVPSVEPDEFIANPNILDTPNGITDKRLLEKYAEARASMQERVTIWKFFKNIFDFDPDKQVASALQTNTARDPPPKTKATHTALSSKKNSIRNVQKKDYEYSVDELKERELNSVEEGAYGTIPSVDTFAKWDRYLEENYEQVLDVAKNAYGCQLDIDFMVNIYDKHLTKDDANKFKDRNMDNVIAPITLIRRNHWTILGPYRENRERVDFLNRRTEILREMLDQREKDSHTATDIMQKRIKNKKKENDAEAGPDDKAFRRYIKQNKSQVANMGGIYGGEEDEEDDCPKDAVEVNVFTLQDGGREMKVHKIYNPAEAPQTK